MVLVTRKVLNLFHFFCRPATRMKRYASCIQNFWKIFKAWSIISQLHHCKIFLFIFQCQFKLFSNNFYVSNDLVLKRCRLYFKHWSKKISRTSFSTYCKNHEQTVIGCVVATISSSSFPYCTDCTVQTIVRYVNFCMTKTSRFLSFLRF